MITHGEVWFQKKQNIKLKNGYCTEIAGLPNRMKPREAARYYRNKIRDYFDENLTVKDFDKVEDYFGFFEAKRILAKA